MKTPLKVASTTAYIVVIVGLAGLPVAAPAQQEAIAEYNRNLDHKAVAVVDENRDLREAIDRLDSRIGCLEAPRKKCVSKAAGRGTDTRDSNAVPTRKF